MDDSWPQELIASSVVTEKLLTEELVLVVAPDHALAHLQHVTVEELRDKPFVLFKPGTGLRYTVIQRWFDENLFVHTRAIICTQALEAISHDNTCAANPSTAGPAFLATAPHPCTSSKGKVSLCQTRGADIPDAANPFASRLAGTRIP